MTLRRRQFQQERIAVSTRCARDNVRRENAGIHMDITGIHDHLSPLVEIHAALATVGYAGIASRVGRDVPCIYRSSIECFNE